MGLKSQKMTIFARFLSFSRFLGPKKHENLYFYKISKIKFFWHPMRVVYMDLQLIWIKIGDLHKLLPKFRLKITFVFIIYKDLPMFCETLVTLTGRHFAKKIFFFNSVKKFDQSIDWSLISIKILFLTIYHPLPPPLSP